MENLYELLEEAAHKVPTKGIVIVNNSQCDLFLTYSELREKSRKIAFILKSYYQVKPVSKIIISVEKSENFILLFWGCVMAGCIPVLMPSVQFSNKNSIAFERLKNAIDILGVVTLITNDINLFEYYKSSFHKAVCVEDIMKQLDLLQDYSLHIPKRDSKDLCVIQFSSGSTGAPKGVMLSFNNILTNLKIKTLADEITTEDTLIHWMPYFHDYGLFGNHLVCLYNQITEIKIEPFSFLRDPLIFLKKISEYQVSICGGTTPSGLDLLIQKLEQSNDIKELDLSQVKTLSIGAEMVPSNLYVRLSPLFQLGFNRNAFRPSYGMAETTLIVSSCLPGYGNKNIRINREAFYEGIIKLVDKQQDFCEFVSAGRILPGLQVRIVKDGIPQNNLNLGEIQVKGACVMSGYYNDIQSTDEVLKDGWLSTGDLGFFDYNNILYIVGRKKETIIVNGQNFHPFDLENCVLEKFGLSIEKTVFTSFYSSTENREIVLEAENVITSKYKDPISFKAYKGEITGIFGLVGAGRTELARVLFGIDRSPCGTIKKDGKVLNLKSAKDAINNKIGMVPEDRKQLGLVLKHNVQDNLTVVKLKDLPWLLKSDREEAQITDHYINALSIATRGGQQIVGRLSGGNQQKVVISKWLSLDLDVLILDEPTRGVDVKAKAEIYDIMRKLADQGVSIIMISSDLPEILRVSHRVIVMHDGKITLDGQTKDYDQEKIMHAAIS